MRRPLQFACAFLLLAASAPAFAQQPDVRCTPERGGHGCGFANRVLQALDTLDLGCKRWTILILDDAEWLRMAASHARAGGVLHTRYSFSLLSLRRTYLREPAFPERPVPLLVEVLAHEFAHLRICGRSESCARDTALRIVTLTAKEQAP